MPPTACKSPSSCTRPTHLDGSASESPPGRVSVTVGLLAAMATQVLSPRTRRLGWWRRVPMLYGTPPGAQTKAAPHDRWCPPGTADPSRSDISTSLPAPAARQRTSAARRACSASSSLGAELHRVVERNHWLCRGYVRHAPQYGRPGARNGMCGASRVGLIRRARPRSVGLPNVEALRLRSGRVDSRSIGHLQAAKGEGGSLAAEGWS